MPSFKHIITGVACFVAFSPFASVFAINVSSMSVAQLVHLFGTDGKISTTVGWLSMKSGLDIHGPQRTNIDIIGDPLTFFQCHHDAVSVWTELTLRCHSYNTAIQKNVFWKKKKTILLALFHLIEFCNFPFFLPALLQWTLCGLGLTKKILFLWKWSLIFTVGILDHRDIFCCLLILI